MHQSVSANHPDCLARGALRHAVVNRVMAEIFHGDLPAGTRLIVQKIAARFGISATPVREALVELEAVGLVHFVHNRGAVVKPFGPGELRDVFRVRRILETESTRLACTRIDPGALRDLREETARLAGGAGGDDWAEREMAADRRLHQMTAEACGSSRLYDEIERYNSLVQALREIVGNRRQAQQRAMEEHLAVIDALLAGDPDDAAAQMGRHINRTAADVEAIVFARGSFQQQPDTVAAETGL